MMGPPSAEKGGGEGLTRRATAKLTTTATDHRRRLTTAQVADPQVFAVRANVDESKEILAALDVINDANADAAFERRALAVLGEYEKKNQFAMRPSESDFARIAAAIGFTSEQITAAWASYQRNGKFAAILAMSWQALKWALDCDKHESTAERVVLIEYANHADDRGYSWPSLKFIASRWRSHPTRLRRARDSIIAKKLLFRTKKRRGFTGQNKVFRMPKCTYERGAESPPLKKDKGGRKGDDKGAIRGSQSPTNLESLTREEAEAQNFASSSSLKKAEKKTKSRGALKRPTNEENDLSRPEDASEVWHYIYNGDDDHPEEETAPLEKYFRELAGADEDDEEGDRDIASWLLANDEKGWSGITDWRVYLRKTFQGGWFPSQKREAKRKAKRRQK